MSHRFISRLPLAVLSLVCALSLVGAAGARAAAEPGVLDYDSAAFHPDRVGAEPGVLYYDSAAFHPAAPASPSPVPATSPPPVGAAATPGASGPDRTGYRPDAPDPSTEPPFAGLSLYRPDAYTHQYNQQLCTGASIQMMVNLVTGASDHSGQRQIDYLDYEMHHSQYSMDDIGGMPDGWAAALANFGAGDYRVLSYPTLDEAVKAAAKSMRLTGRPAGLVIHDGGHAWVMAGFTSTGGDPAVSDDFSVTSVVVMAPDYGTIRDDPAPGTALPMAALAKLATPYTATNFPTVWTGRYLVVEPSVPAAAPAGAI